MTNTPLSPAIEFIHPEFPVYGVGPCSHLMKVEYVTHEYGNEEPGTEIRTMTLGITPDGVGKWKFYAGRQQGGEFHFWDISAPTVLTAFQDAWDELVHEDYITSYDQMFAQSFTLGNL